MPASEDLVGAAAGLPASVLIGHKRQRLLTEARLVPHLKASPCAFQFFHYRRKIPCIRTKAYRHPGERRLDHAMPARPFHQAATDKGQSRSRVKGRQLTQCVKQKDLGIYNLSTRRLATLDIAIAARAKQPLHFDKALRVTRSEEQQEVGHDRT